MKPQRMLKLDAMRRPGHTIRTAAIVPLLLLAAGAQAQQAAIPIEIAPPEAGLNSTVGSQQMVNALLSKELLLADYRVVRRGPAAAPETNSSPRLMAGVSVTSHTKTLLRGGKNTLFGEAQPTTTVGLTEVLVLLEVRSPESGRVICVAEGKATYRGRTATPYTGGSGYQPGLGGAQPAPDNLPPIDAGDLAGAQESGGNASTPPDTEETPPAPGGRVAGRAAPKQVVPTQEDGAPVNPRLGTGLRGQSALGSDEPLDATNLYASAQNNSSPEAQSALRSALHSAVFSLQRSALERALQSAASVKILDVDGASLVIDAGSERGYHKGDLVTLQRSARKVRNDATGEEIPVGFRVIAELRLTDVQPGHSEAALLSGAAIRAASDQETDRLVVKRSSASEEASTETSTAPLRKSIKPAVAVSVPAPSKPQPRAGKQAGRSTQIRANKKSRSSVRAA